MNISKLLLISSLLICLFTHNSYSQTEDDRKEYYKTILAKGETAIKSFNIIKKDIHDNVFSNEHNGVTTRSEFQCAYALFLTNYFQNLNKLTSEFEKMNSFRIVPEMSYLNQMNTIVEKKNNLLSEGIRCFEEISSEINSKPFKRWDTKVIDNFVLNYNTPIEFEMYKLLRPICQDIFSLNLCRNQIAYLNCTYTDWSFMAKNEFEETTDVGNPLLNFNMICYKQIFDPKKSEMAWELGNIQKDNIDDKLDFSKIIFKDYPDNYIFSSWMIDSININKSRNKDNLYGKGLANASNTLSLLFLIKSLDFENSVLNQLLEKYKLKIKNCTYDEYYNEYKYDTFDDEQALLLFYENKIFDIDPIDRENIKLLSSILPKESPWFYLEKDAESYNKIIEKFDSSWFNVYQIKKNIILSSAILLSVTNELELNNINSDIFHKWINGKFEANQLKAYFQNEYMKKMGKNDNKIWSADNVYIEDLLNKLRLINFLVNDNFKSFKNSYEEITSTDEFDKFLNSTLKNNITKDDKAVISNNHKEIFDRESYLTYIQGNQYLSFEKFINFSANDRNIYIQQAIVRTSNLNGLGWRSLLKNHLESAEKYFLAGLTTHKTAYEYSRNANEIGVPTWNVFYGIKLSPEYPLITLNLAHVMLFKGDNKKAKKLYTKYPMDQIIPELQMDVKSAIKMDFDEFIKIGRDPQIFEEIRKELGL
jgi:hypothetical protein